MSQLDDILKDALVGLKGPLGDPATYAPTGGGPASITVLISDLKPFEINNPGNLVECDVYLDELSALPVRDDTVTIGSIEYSVLEALNDVAIGISTLTLRKK